VALVFAQPAGQWAAVYDRYYDPLWPKRKGCTYPLPFHGIQMAYQDIWDGVTS